MKWRRFNRLMHRDLGYFFFGMCIIYGISGIALNHRHQWNPNYVIHRDTLNLSLKQLPEGSDEMSIFFLDQLDDNYRFRTSLQSAERLRIFIKDGSVQVDLETGKTTVETIRRRPILREMNFLHYNTSKQIWTWFADLFGLGLVILAVSGLFMVKGKKGLKGRGGWFAAVGILIPLIMLLLYFSG